MVVWLIFLRVNQQLQSSMTRRSLPSLGADAGSCDIPGGMRNWILGMGGGCVERSVLREDLRRAEQDGGWGLIWVDLP